MNIRRRGNRWQVQVRIRGISKTKTFSDKKSCTLWGKEVEKKLLQFDKSQISKDTTVEVMIWKYIEDFTNFKKSYVAETYRWKKIIKDYQWLVKLHILEVSPENIIQFKKQRLKNDNFRSFNMDLGLLNNLFKKCRKHYRYPISNPCIDIEKASENKYGRSISFSPKHYRQLMKAPIPYRVFFLLCRHTGARPFSELSKLVWNDIDDINKVIYIRRRMTTDNNGRRNLSLKTNSASRQIPISDFLIRQIKLLKKYRTTLVFPVKPRGINSYFQRFKKRNGIEDFQIYDLRRKFVKTLVNKDMDVKRLAKLTGHSWSHAETLIELYSGETNLRVVGD